MTPEVDFPGAASSAGDEIEEKKIPAAIVVFRPNRVSALGRPFTLPFVFPSSDDDDARWCVPLVLCDWPRIVSARARPRSEHRSDARRCRLCVAGGNREEKKSISELGSIVPENVKEKEE